MGKPTPLERWLRIAEHEFLTLDAPTRAKVALDIGNPRFTGTDLPMHARRQLSERFAEVQERELEKLLGPKALRQARATLSRLAGGLHG